jgi:mono/diheme cytochrome c family protein
MKKNLILLASLVLAAGLGFAQNQPQTKPVVKHTPIKQTSPASGKEMFSAYCAPCHGADGKGNGPAASSLKVPPTDLTQMARKHDGKFPANYLASTLKFGSGTAAGAHGSVDMPVWGPLFQSLDRFHDTSVQQRVSNLVGYVESIQAQ